MLLLIFLIGVFGMGGVDGVGFGGLILGGGGIRVGWGLGGEIVLTIMTTLSFASIWLLLLINASIYSTNSN